jgi:N-methylhydantoinase A
MEDTPDTRVGVDVGGTFTDLVAVEDGRVSVRKTPSTPDAPERGVFDALDAGDVDRATFFGHGTTVATNAVLEGTWSDTALVTTEGFRDVLEIGRQDRPELYDSTAAKPDPVVPRDRRIEVTERITHRGGVETPLTDDEVAAAVAAVPDDVDSVAVCLLFAFENPVHERRLAAAFEDAGYDVSASHEVLPEIREFERTATTTLNAALAPVMRRYLGSLASGVDDRGLPSARIMASNGGLVAAASAADRPVQTLLSGPAAGVQGAAYVGEAAGLADLVTMDMGGTSCDVSLVRDCDPVVTTEATVGDYPASVPTVDVHTVGAGGGSVAWVDEGGALRVGPRSAGAQPGPVCYGRGGERPTVTDAHAVLGRIDPGEFVEEPADPDAVRAAVASRVADPLDLGVEEAAQGIVDVADANMERALRVVSVERGHDPREFGLVAYGGAGPLHAARLGERLGVECVLVPAAAGVLSALGLLCGDVTYGFGRTMVRRWGAVDPSDVADVFAEFREEGEARLAAAGVSADRRRFDRRVDVRYRGQSFTLTVDVPDGDVTRAALGAVAKRFHERHRERYGHAAPEEPLELVAVRADARGVVDPPELGVDEEAASGDPVSASSREVAFEGAFRETAVYDRDSLRPGHAFEGPALVTGGETTLVLPPDHRARVDAVGNVVLRTGGDDE